MAPSFGTLLRQAREVRGLSGSDAARAAGISAAYLSKLESDAVKKPSPHVLHQLSEALAVPYAELMRLSGYLVPDASDSEPGRTSAPRCSPISPTTSAMSCSSTSPGTAPAGARAAAPPPRPDADASAAALTGVGERERMDRPAAVRLQEPARRPSASSPSRRGRRRAGPGPDEPRPTRSPSLPCAFRSCWTLFCIASCGSPPAAAEKHSDVRQAELRRERAGEAVDRARLEPPTARGDPGRRRLRLPALLDRPGRGVDELRLNAPSPTSRAGPPAPSRRRRRRTAPCRARSAALIVPRQPLDRVGRPTACAARSGGGRAAGT